MNSDFIRLKAIKPVLSGYISEAATLLGESGIKDEKVVHDVRVLMKKSRAVLKLIDSQIDTGTARNEIRELKEVGRALTASRETSVLRKTVKDLRKKYPDLFDKLSGNLHISSLLHKPDESKETHVNDVTEEKKIIELLRKSGYRIRFITMTNLDPLKLFRELERAYNRVADAYLACRKEPKKEKLHTFRKRSKDFLYMLIFFRPLNQAKVKALEEKIEKMTASLGKYNDLCQLIDILDYKHTKDLNSAILSVLILRIREEQDFLLGKIWPTAFKIFCPGQNLIAILGFKIMLI